MARTNLTRLYDRRAFVKYAEHLRDYYGLVDWEIVMEEDPEYIAACKHSERVLAFSDAKISTANAYARFNVIIHEFAHAIEGPEIGHGEAWQKRVFSMGGVPHEIIDTNSVIFREKRSTWVAVCPNGHRWGSKHKPATFDLSCSVCGPFGYLWMFRLMWFHGERMVFDPNLPLAYQPAHV